MSALTRRTLLAGAAAAIVAPMWVSPQMRAQAKPQPARKQVIGWYRYKIGSFEVTVATDGVSRFKFADDHVGNKTRAEVNAALVQEHLEPDLMTTPYNPIVINT